MYSTASMSTHLFIPKKELRDLESAKERLTITPKFDGEPVELFEEYSQEFGIPLYYYRNAAKVAKKVVDNRLEGSKVQYNFTSDLRPGQVPLIQRFQKYLTSGGTGYILEAPPGFGKTVVIIKMCTMIQRSAIVVVPRSNLVDQWVERFLEHTDIPKSKIGVINGDTVRYRGKSVVVGLVHSLSKFVGHQEFPFLWGTAVFDEVDRSVPPTTFSPIVGMFPAKYRIGTSATLERTDGMHEVFQHHIGQYFLKGRDVGRMTPKILIHEFNKSSGKLWMGSAKLNRRGMLLSKLANNPQRNALIAKYTKLIYNSGRRCVILSDRKEQLVTLRNLMFKMHGVPLSETGMYVRSAPTGNGKQRKISDTELKRVATDCKILFATYGMMGIGTDIPDLAGLVYATPQSQVEQSKGRIERLCEGKLEPIVVDIIDTAYQDTMRWANARKRQYRSAGSKITVRR